MKTNSNIFSFINITIILCFISISGVIFDVNAADNDTMTINVNGTVKRDCSLSIPESRYDLGVISASVLNDTELGAAIPGFAKTVPFDINCNGGFKVRIVYATSAVLDEGGCYLSERDSVRAAASICALSPDNTDLKLGTSPASWEGVGSGTRNFTFFLRKHSQVLLNDGVNFGSGHFDIGFNITIEPI